MTQAEFVAVIAWFAVGIFGGQMAYYAISLLWDRWQDSRPSSPEVRAFREKLVDDAFRYRSKRQS